MNKILNEKINSYIVKYSLNSLDLVENAREFVIMLLADILCVSINDIKLNKCNITTQDFLKLDNILKSISENKIPPEYLTNKSYIYGLEFYVNENVLIPRQDTETIIETAINEIKINNYKTILDLCTGSGIIGITCAVKSNIKKVDLVDISNKALDVCKVNINNLDNLKKCSIIQSNMFDKLYNLKTTYDIIVSNPPYLTHKEMNEVSDFVKNEPNIALYGGEDGLDFYRNIYSNVKYFLNNLGMVVVEIGYNQKEDVINIIKEHNEYKDIKIIKDMNNKDRVILCRFQKR